MYQRADFPEQTVADKETRPNFSEQIVADEEIT